MVGGRIANLIPDSFLGHNLCSKCPNGSCKATLDIYTSISFQQYKKHFNARCSDPYNRVLSFQKSRRTPKSHFQECEWRPHTSLNVGLRHFPPLEEKVNVLIEISLHNCNRFLWILGHQMPTFAAKPCLKLT
jgi:hypothetical protein